MSAVYNEHEHYAAQWLRNLIKAGHIAPGEVDERSILDVHPDDYRGFTQVHCFAGLGGWPYALRRTGWPDDRPVWTGSAPCQPFSVAGAGKGKADERHLWPAWFRLVEQCRPAVIFGEQVEAAIKHGWLDLVFDDLEKLGYACGAIVFPAASVGAPHIRHRLYFVADANLDARLARGLGDAEQSPNGRDARRSSFDARDVADADGEPSQWLAEPRGERGFWRVEPDVGRVADGVSDRVDKLRALGNAIVPQAAQAFIESYLDCQR